MTAYLRYLRVWTDFSESNSFYNANKNFSKEGHQPKLHRSIDKKEALTLKSACS